MTSIDTNIVVAYGSPNPVTKEVIANALLKAAQVGPLCVCGAVFSELMGFPGRTERNLRDLLEVLRVAIDWQFEEADWFAAGLAYQGYVSRRRESGGGLPRRIATDFLVGAHASVRGYSLLTADKRLFGAAFPNLKIESF